MEDVCRRCLWLQVVLASFLETFIAIWNWLKVTATRIAGQDSREQPGIAA